MAVTKEDVLNFGNAVNNTLAKWGEQIQYSRDISKLKKVQNQLSNIKNFTTDKDGKPLGYEDIAKNIMNINTQLSDIQTPDIMKYAQTNVANFIKTNVGGLTNRVQNQFEQGMDAITNPKDSESVKKLTDSLQPGMYQFKPGTPNKTYAAKIINKLVFDGNGNLDRNKVEQVALMTDNRGNVTQQSLGYVTRDKLSYQDKLDLMQQEYGYKEDIARIPNVSYNYNSGTITTIQGGKSTVKGSDGKNYIQDNTSQKLYDEKTKTWKTPQELGITVQWEVGTSTSNSEKQNNTIQKQFEEANNIIKNRFSKDEIDALNEAIDSRSLFGSPLWNRLSDYEKNLLRSTILSKYSETMWNKDWYQKDENDNLF